jgi:hypothetical protein
LHVCPGWQTFPEQQGWPVSPQHAGWPAPPQHAPFWQVPTAHPEVLATHKLVVSQQPLAPVTPLHMLPAQQACVAPPQAWHRPLAQTVPAPHDVFGNTQAPALQQFEPVQAFDAQHCCVLAPQALHVPF